MTATYYGLTSVLDPTFIKITQSDLAAFKRDRRVWFLKTYLGLRPNATNRIGPLELGTMVHAALEQRYKFGVDMLPWYEAHARELEELYALADPYFRRDDWNKQAEQGRVMLEGYEEWIDAGNLDARYKTLEIEKLLLVETMYDGHRVVLSGKVDQLVQDRRTSEVLVFDWKTSANLERTIKQAHNTEQLPFYIALQEAIDPTMNIAGAAFNILLKSKRTERARPPFYVRELVRYDRRALAARKAGIDGAIADYVRVVTALNAGVPEPLRIAYPNPGVQSWDRDLEPLIDIMDNGGNVAGIIAAQYTQIDPYARYAEPESPLLDEE